MESTTPLHRKLISATPITGVSAVLATIYEHRSDRIVGFQSGGYQARKPHVQGLECGTVYLAPAEHQVIFLVRFIKLGLMETVRIKESPKIAGMGIIPVG